MFPFPIAVARPVGKKELEASPEALKARGAEWDRLRKQHVWDIESVREWKDVAREARLRGEEVMFGHVFGICVEKNFELPKDDPKRKFKCRVVFKEIELLIKIGSRRSSKI